MVDRYCDSDRLDVTVVDVDLMIGTGLEDNSSSLYMCCRTSSLNYIAIIAVLDLVAVVHKGCDELRKCLRAHTFTTLCRSPTELPLKNELLSLYKCLIKYIRP